MFELVNNQHFRSTLLLYGLLLPQRCNEGHSGQPRGELFDSPFHLICLVLSVGRRRDHSSLER